MSGEGRKPGHATARPPRRVLVANRGEIACRILATLQRLGIESVAVYSDADSGSPHVRRATRAVRLGPAPVAESYLRGDAIVAAALAEGADAVHPGYGLLSENADFAERVELAGMAFLGPTPSQIREFGLKHRARELAAAAGVPVSPGSGVLADATDAARHAARLGYPVLLKATAGGGGIGMWLCHDEGELAREYDRVARLARSHFGSGETFLERFVSRARHVEVQIFGDGRGSAIALGERDCSLQRRRQKVFEETPAPRLDAALAEALRSAAVRLAKSVGYRSAGTVEFLVDAERGEFFFLEVNTRLQVEHGVTEAVCGVDLVEWMVRLGGGDASPMASYVHRPRGHAIEVRLYAEDPAESFRPSAGTLTEVRFPASARVDTWVEAGSEVTPFYDPLVAKLICHGRSRTDALERLRDALAEVRLEGLRSNLDYARALAAWQDFAQANHHTRSLETFEFRSPCVEVLDGGAMTTVQDWPGRIGYWHVGVPPSGPMDSLALRIGNRILGNREGTAGLEIAVRGPTLRFGRRATVCLAGAPTAFRIDARPAPMWEALDVAAGATVEIGEVAGPGARSYLQVRGGFDVALYLGSRSTFTLGRFGGHGGRPLAAADSLELGSEDDPEIVIDGILDAGAARAMAQHYSERWELRVVDGPHAAPEFFTEEDIRRFYDEPFEVHFQSARTGVRLVGPKPAWARSDGGEAGLHPSNIHDTAYAVGAVDYTGDMPVVLGPDGPSLGGFVCPAVVIDADLWKLGQLRPGDRCEFRAVTLAEAVDIRRRQDAWLAARSTDLDLRGDPLPSSKGPRGPRGPAALAHRVATDAKPSVTYRPSGDRYLLVEYGPMTLDIDLRIRVQLLQDAIESARRAGELDGLVDLTAGVRSLQIHYDPACIDARSLVAALERIDDGVPSGAGLRLPTRVVHLPLSWNDPEALRAVAKYASVVRDDAPWCPDNVEFIRRANGLESVEEVRRIVFDASYLVLGLGDVYLGAPVAVPVDPRHRLVTTKYNPARTWTPENAVGIGGAYLCVYGMEGPGGYQLVGRTIPVWSTYERWRGSAAGSPWLLRSFDQIRFYPVEADELLEARRLVADGRFDVRIDEAAFDVDAHHRFLASIADDTCAFRARQRDALATERRRWVESGEFEAARRAEGRGDDQTPAVEFEAPDGAFIVRSPLGAQVWSIPVEEGQRVRAGDELVVLAAMKTETPVLAPAAGIVGRLACTAGQVVRAGAPLAALLPET